MKFFIVTDKHGSGMLFGKDGATRLWGQMARFLTRSKAEEAMNEYNSSYANTGHQFCKIQEITV